MYLLSRNCVLKTSRRLNKIKWVFFGNKFTREQEAERLRWNPPYVANAATFGTNCCGGSGKSRIIHTIGSGGELLFTNALGQIELPIGLADVQESVDAAEQF